MNICASDKAGTVHIAHNGRRYVYFNVPDRIKGIVKKLASKGYTGAAFNKLNPYSATDVKQIIKERNSDRERQLDKAQRPRVHT